MSNGTLNLQSISILLVDDDSLILEAMKTLVSRVVGTTYTASNGKDGLDLYKLHSPDMVISDIKMPLLSGLDMSTEIKKINPDQAIAIVSAYTDTDLLLQSINIGIDKYIPKPLKKDMLIKWIKKISKQILAQKELKLKEENIHFIMNHNPDAICMIDNNKISYLNHSFLALMELDSFKNFDINKHCIVNYIVNEDGSQRFSELKYFKEFLMNCEKNEIIVRMLIQNSDINNIHFYNLFFKIYAEIGRIILIFTDITNIEQERSLYKIQATTDALTNIPNRMYFDLYLDNQITSAMRDNSVFSLIMFDIDDFKMVNDTYGHPVGDKVLKELVQVVKAHIRKNDFLARWGGEEFMILSKSNTQDSHIVTMKILQAIENHDFEIVGKVTCSFGISSFIKDSTRETILNNVDKALYNAKKSGKNCIKLQ